MGRAVSYDLATVGCANDAVQCYDILVILELLRLGKDRKIVINCVLYS